MLNYQRVLRKSQNVNSCWDTLRISKIPENHPKKKHLSTVGQSRKTQKDTDLPLFFKLLLQNGLSLAGDRLNGTMETRVTTLLIQ